MSLERKMSELTGNGHSSGVPYAHSDVVRPDVNPFVHRLHISAVYKLQVRASLLMRDVILSLVYTKLRWERERDDHEV